MGEKEKSKYSRVNKKFEEHIGDNINKVINFYENNEIIGEFTIVIKVLKNLIKIFYLTN